MDSVFDPTDLDRRVWTLLADGLAAGEGPWREGVFCCFGPAGDPWIQALAVRGVRQASHTLCVRGVPADLGVKDGASALWTFSDPRTGLRASVDGRLEAPADPVQGTWGVRVLVLTVAYLADGKRLTRRFDYGPPLSAAAYDPMDTLI